MEKDFKHISERHTLKNNSGKQNSWISTCIHPRPGMGKVTDATAVTGTAPAEQQGKLPSSWGKAGRQKSPSSLGKQGGENRNRAHPPKKEFPDMWALLSIWKWMFLRTTRAWQIIQISFQFTHLTAHQLNPGFLQCLKDPFKQHVNILKKKMPIPTESVQTFK